MTEPANVEYIDSATANTLAVCTYRGGRVIAIQDVDHVVEFQLTRKGAEQLRDYLDQRLAAGDPDIAYF